jgi:immune inhibitor A
MPAGSYKVFLGSKDVKEQRFQPFRCGENTGKIYYAVVKGSDGSYTVDANPKQYTTIIRSVSIDRQPSQQIYDLQGRPRGTDLSALPKGIYIIGGKKVVK